MPEEVRREGDSRVALAPRQLHVSAHLELHPRAVRACVAVRRVRLVPYRRIPRREHLARPRGVGDLLDPRPAAGARHRRSARTEDDVESRPPLSHSAGVARGSEWGDGLVEVRASEHDAPTVLTRRDQRAGDPRTRVPVEWVEWDDDDLVDEGAVPLRPAVQLEHRLADDRRDVEHHQVAQAAPEPLRRPRRAGAEVALEAVGFGDHLGRGRLVAGSEYGEGADRDATRQARWQSHVSRTRPEARPAHRATAARVHNARGGSPSGNRRPAGARRAGRCRSATDAGPLGQQRRQEVLADDGPVALPRAVVAGVRGDCYH